MTDLILGIKKFEHRQDLPAWDRTVDVVCHQRKHGDARIQSDDLFRASMSLLRSNCNAQENIAGYFSLSPRIRFKVCRLVMPESRHRKPITLTRRTFRRDVWKDSDFQILSEALAPIRKYLRVSSTFRADFLVAFLCTNSFHAVISPYVDRRLSPLITQWLVTYGPFMQNLILEIDMTKLGLGPKTEAADLSSGRRRMEQLLQRIVESQRHRKTPLSELVLLCRRFYGRRDTHIESQDEHNITPNKQSSRASTRSVKTQKSKRYSSTSSSPDGPLVGGSQSPDTSDGSWTLDSFYCPDENLFICNQLLHLRGRVLSLRMCGFSDSYTHRFVATMFPEGTGRFAHRMAPSGKVWPRLHRQSSWITQDDGSMVLDGHTTSDQGPASRCGPAMPPPPVVHMDGTLSLPVAPRPALRRTTKVIGSKAPETAQISTSQIDRSTRKKYVFGKCGTSKDKKIAV